ncbi:hypothetical protein OUZ56_007048 [Daphnia magna]|uniref:EGF-like domain-containing protein n=1 Tax=Daphnia magna TaxID=35525 RepID=A0ABQ9YXG6_9CRUS|nr:hypothetical protein OUZ56_007048 [Daphnia magna]
MRLLWFGLVVLVQLPNLISAACDGKQFACKNGHGCVATSQHCDHVIDCDDGSDEFDCNYPCRSPHMKPCRDGHCIAMYFFCDRDNDCGDWSDELNCTGLLPGSRMNCPSNTFHCEGQVCIPQNWVCDGMEDCSDARDELHCNKTIECKNGFQCGKECILNQWVCDGVADCADGSDEKECGPDAYMNHSCLPEHGWFSCLSKGSKKCMPISRACDGYVDCDDGADEGGQCNSTSNCSNDTHCPNECHKTPRGPICSCPQGFQLNGTTCVDIDECSIDPPLCSQKCSNSRGGFECSCVAGYTPGARDKKSCIANGPEPMLVITTDRDIRYISIPSKEYGLVQSGISQAHGVTGDYEDGFIYWNEKTKDKAGIYKSMVDGSAFQYVVSVGVEMVEDLAIDWVGRHIYFTDSGRKHIVVCDFHATICTVVITGQLDKPRAVAVYPEEGMLFWSDWGSQPHIGSAGMDGSQRKNVITTDIVWPNGLVVDETIQRIFWGDAKLNRIESSRLDGSDRKILAVKVTHPYALDIFENTIFWSDPLEHEVLSVDKFTGKDYKILIKETSFTPTGIHVHHPSKQNLLSNPCRNIICSHLCLLSPSVQGFRCACPVGMTLNKDNRTCDSISSHESSIVIATYTDIFRLTHHQIGKDSITRLPTRNVENIGALAFNPLGHSIIYSDMSQRTIYSMHLETYRQEVLFENADMVEGLDVDPFTENIYWTEVTQGTILVGHKNHVGVYERLVLARDLHSPKGITIASEYGLMFIVEGRISHVISVWHMDGGSRQELVQAYGTVSAMAYDGKHLYFSDSLRGTIERIEVDGQNRTILRSHLGTPVAMDASSDSVFWLTQFSTRISWLNKQDPKTMRGFVIDASDDLSVQYRLMTVVDQFNFDSHEHSCLGHSGGCSDICSPTPNGATCLCPLGKVLAEDKHVCNTVNCVGDQWFKCQNGCIPAKYRCDGVNDCPLGEDELQCRNATTEVGCTSTQFQCNNGGCVSMHFYCDGDADCQDRSDEPDTCPPFECLSDSEYSCPNQHHCIPRSAMCDGQADCMDKSDEANCTSTHSMCSATQFYCSHSRLCIPLTWVCDRDPDCEHGEDEETSFCTNVNRKPMCPINYLRCPQRPDCMPRMALCNSIAECEHGTDEELCAKLNESATEKIKEPEVECSSLQYNCFLGTNECISMSSRCDCRFDCMFGEDEEGCENLPFSCKTDLFRCPNEMRYINISWVCDGLSDCSNSADEEPTLCPTNTSIPTARSSSPSMDPDIYLCSEDEFQCANGQCIPTSLVCDRERQCTDGTDEGSGCINSCQNNGHCPQICIPGPKEPTCQCEVGYESLNNGHQCVDVDECSAENKCSQYCNNTKGSYRCSCSPGYTLEYDQHTCKAANGRPMLIVATNYHAEILLNSDVDSSRLLVQSSLSIKGIAYHDKLSSFYWITAEGVRRSNNGGQSLIFKINDLLPSGLALDKTTGNIYYSAVKNVTRNGQDQSVIRVIAKSLEADVNIITTQSIITDIALDSLKGLLFWSEHTKPYTGRIVRATMDGRSTMWLYSVDKIMYPTAITLDQIKSRIYWADITLRSISSCDYNGMNQRHEVAITNGQPLSLTFFENRLTWSVRDQDVLYSQVINGSSISEQRLNEHVSQIITVHSVLEPELPNHCAFSPCNNGICVLKNSSSFTCHCPIGVAVTSSNPFKCSGKSPEVVTVVPSAEAGINPDYIESPSSPGVTVASILICLAVLTILAVLGWIYYRRWRRTIGSPLKFRFRNALGLTEESTAWEESVDYGDRKRLFIKSDDPDDHGCGPQVMVDQNDNRTTALGAPHRSPVNSSYSNLPSIQPSLGKSHPVEDRQPQLLPATYSMKDQLLASEL